MKLPIRRITGSIPPKFEYYQMVTLPQGGVQSIRHESCIVPSMEAALCDLLRIAEQLAKDNEVLRSIKK